MEIKSIRDKNIREWAWCRKCQFGKDPQYAEKCWNCIVNEIPEFTKEILK